MKPFPSETAVSGSRPAASSDVGPCAQELNGDESTAGHDVLGVRTERKPLRAWRSVLDLLGLAQGIQRFVDREEDRRLK